MIDTIKLSIYRIGNSEFYNSLLNNTNQKINGFILNNKHNLVEKSEMFVYKEIEYENHYTQIINGKFIPSHNYNINYRIFEDRVELEFSLPKLIYGTNVLMLHDHNRGYIKSPYQLLVTGVKYFFEQYFGLFKINYGYVKIMRWDFCFNQLFNNRVESLKALNYIKLKHKSKHDRLSYEYGIAQITKTNYLKIYHKGEEFLKHDKHKIDSKYIQQIENMSQCILRYEKKCTPKNMAYYYNMNFCNHSEFEKKLYMKAKINGRVKKYQRRLFENVQHFTLGNSKLMDCTKLDEIFFNHIYTRFREEIRKKFSLGKTSISQLKKEVIENNNHKEKAKRIKIMAFIKEFGSLKRAREEGAMSESTYLRWKKYLENNDMSETKVNVNINQDWTNRSYRIALQRFGLYPYNMSKSLEF